MVFQECLITEKVVNGGEKIRILAKLTVCSPLKFTSPKNLRNDTTHK